MIRLGNLHIKNVGPFEEQEFDFSIEKGHPDIHIFTGANGTGKTTILQSLANVLNPNEKRHLINNFYKRFQVQDNEVQVHIFIKKKNQFLGYIKNTYDHKDTSMPMHYHVLKKFKDNSLNKEFTENVFFDTKLAITHQTFKFAAFGANSFFEVLSE